MHGISIHLHIYNNIWKVLELRSSAELFLVNILSISKDGPALLTHTVQDVYELDFMISVSLIQRMAMYY